MKRSENRKPNQIRKTTIKKNYIKHAEGSVLITMGSTKVICTASIDETVPRWMKDTGKGWVTAEYGMLPRSTHERMNREAKKGQSGRTMEISRLIGRALRASVDMQKLGERQIVVDCDVIQADGGTRCASITGGYVALALAIAKLQKQKKLSVNPLLEPVCAISCGIKAKTAILDLDYDEDSTADVDMNFIITGTFVARVPITQPFYVNPLSVMPVTSQVAEQIAALRTMVLDLTTELEAIDPDAPILDSAKMLVASTAPADLNETNVVAKPANADSIQARANPGYTKVSVADLPAALPGIVATVEETPAEQITPRATRVSSTATPNVTSPEKLIAASLEDTADALTYSLETDTRLAQASIFQPSANVFVQARLAIKPQFDALKTLAHVIEQSPKTLTVTDSISVAQSLKTLGFEDSLVSDLFTKGTIRKSALLEFVETEILSDRGIATLSTQTETIVLSLLSNLRQSTLTGPRSITTGMNPNTIFSLEVRGSAASQMGQGNEPRFDPSTLGNRLQVEATSASGGTDTSTNQDAR